MEWTYDNFIREAMKGTDEEKLSLGEEREIKKFRVNLSKLMRQIQEEPPERKIKAVKVIKAAAFSLMAQAPVITPVITAMLQVVTGEDLGGKIDGLSAKMDTLSEKIDALGSKMDTFSEKMDTLSEKMDTLSEKMDTLSEKMDTLSEKMDALGDKMDILGSKMDRMLGLQQETIDLVKRGISILEERLP